MSSTRDSAGGNKGPDTNRGLKTPPLVVGIGSSAGGLEALKRFFAAMPADSGMAFVLVSHLAPDRESLLPEILQHSTAMEVRQAEENMQVAGDRVYIIPPDTELVIFNSTLQLHKRKKGDDSHRPVDAFLRSLAEDYHKRSAAVILSGTGTDGSLGVKAVKEEGGLVLVQDSQSAKFDGMIRAACNTRLVDHVMAVEEMPEFLSQYLCHLDEPAGEKSDEEQSSEHSLHKIFALLRAATGHDFSLYKKNTILRRVERRMFVHQLDSLDEYVDYLDDSKREKSILFKELLIGVTNFFRDEQLFDKLRHQYLPELLRSKEDGYHFRVWVPGCSSGEEVYSLAIVLSECLEGLDRSIHLQLFGTDLDEEAVGAARAGVYPDSIALDVDASRLEKFFIKEQGSYRIKKHIREMAVFAKQDVIKDPPFTKLDLLSCRNLLIYFGAELQKKLLPVFHYSLKEDGILVLGTSENLGRMEEGFDVLDSKWKIFRRRPDHDGLAAAMQLPKRYLGTRGKDKGPAKAAVAAKEQGGLRLLKAILSQSGLPACVVVDDRGELVYSHGRTGRFFEPAEGEVSTNILKMARSGLEAPLTNGIQKMTSERREITMKNIRVKDNGGFRDFDLIFRPLPELHGGRRGLMLILFEETGEEEHQPSVPAEEEDRGNGAQNGELRRLEDELRYTRENLKTTIKELETSNEELQSTNEELQSTNEELQSINEELETSKEELQSLNEEASTVNSELQDRIDALVSSNDDIKNLLDATDIATIFLDEKLQIRRFTPMIARFFHITADDVGRSIEHFASTLVDVDIKELSLQVLDTLEKYEAVIEDREGEKYRMRIRPFRTAENAIEGVVVTFENVTEFKKMVESLAESEESWRKLVEHAPIGLMVAGEGRIAYVNPEALRIFGASSTRELIGTSVAERVHEQSRKRLQEQIGDRDSTWRTAVVSGEKFLRLDGSVVDCQTSATPIIYQGRKATVFYLHCSDDTAQD